MIRCRILSVDGGGIRGVIPATLLAQFETQLSVSLSTAFDVFAGTSTGGIIAAALATNAARPKDLSEIYQTAGGAVFYKRNGLSLLNPLAKLFQSKFRPDGLSDFLSHRFDRRTFGHIDSSKQLILTSFDVNSRLPIVFDSKSPQYSDFLISDACLASAAAPTYFPLHAARIGSIPHLLIDGGIAANNPSAIALAQALTQFSPSEIFVVSIGTGQPIDRIPDIDQSKNWGLLKWLPLLMDMLFQGNSGVTDDILGSILPSENYVRIQIPLDRNCCRLDDSSRANVNRLVAAAGRYCGTKEGVTTFRRIFDVLNSHPARRLMHHSSTRTSIDDILKSILSKAPEIRIPDFHISDNDNPAIMVETSPEYADHDKRSAHELSERLTSLVTVLMKLDSLTKDLDKTELRMLHHILNHSHSEHDDDL